MTHTINQAMNHTKNTIITWFGTVPILVSVSTIFLHRKKKKKKKFQFQSKETSQYVYLFNNNFQTISAKEHKFNNRITLITKFTKLIIENLLQYVFNDLDHPRMNPSVDLIHTKLDPKEALGLLEFL